MRNWMDDLDKAIIAFIEDKQNVHLARVVKHLKKPKGTVHDRLKRLISGGKLISYTNDKIPYVVEDRAGNPLILLKDKWDCRIPKPKGKTGPPRIMYASLDKLVRDEGFDINKVHYYDVLGSRVYNNQYGG